MPFSIKLLQFNSKNFYDRIMEGAPKLHCIIHTMEHICRVKCKVSIMYHSFVILLKQVTVSGHKEKMVILVLTHQQTDILHSKQAFSLLL